MPSPRIEVSIVAGGNEDIIVNCVRSFTENYSDIFDNMRINVICNKKEMNISDRLNGLNADINIRHNEKPAGFAKNHNTILAGAAADYYFILNDDLVFIDDSLAGLIEFMEMKENRPVGAVTPRLLNSDGTLQPCTSSFPGFIRCLIGISGLRSKIRINDMSMRLAKFMGKGVGKSRFWNHDKSCEVDTFVGACMIVRGDAVRDAGLMTEATIVGGEETEWHLRFKKKGWKMYYFNDASVIHIGSQTVSLNPFYFIEYFKGCLNYLRKHKSTAERLLFNFGAFFILSIKYLDGILSASAEKRKIAKECIHLLFLRQNRGDRLINENMVD